MLLPILIPLHEKFLQFDWLRAVVFQFNLKYLHVKITIQMDEKFPGQISTEIFFLVESALTVMSIPIIHLANPFAVLMIYHGRKRFQLYFC